jgi:hypothetical protein
VKSREMKRKKKLYEVKLCKGSKSCWGTEGYVGVVKWNGGKVMVECEFNRSWQCAFHYCYCFCII